MERSFQWLQIICTKFVSMIIPSYWKSSLKITCILSCIVCVFAKNMGQGSVLCTNNVVTTGRMVINNVGLKGLKPKLKKVSAFHSLCYDSKIDSWHRVQDMLRLYFRIYWQLAVNSGELSLVFQLERQSTKRNKLVLCRPRRYWLFRFNRHWATLRMKESYRITWC